MAGHKRPHGTPVCPERSPTPAIPETIPQGGAALTRRRYTPEPGFRLPLDGHRRNPNWVDPVRRVEVDRSTHASWVPTVVDGESSSSDEDSQAGSEERVFDDLQDDDDDVRSVAAASTSSSSSSGSFASKSSVTSSLSQLVGNSIPLASLWSTPTRDIPAISHAARKAGVNFAVVAAPKDRRRRTVKSEGSGAALGRQNSWWTVIGQDERAVARIIARAEEDAQGHEDLEEDPCTSGLVVGAYPIHHSHLRPTFLDVMFAGALGGFLVFCGLSML